MRLWEDPIERATQLFTRQVEIDGSFQGLLCPPADLSVTAYRRPALHVYGTFGGENQYATITISSIDDSGLTIYSRDTTKRFLDQFIEIADTH